MKAIIFGAGGQDGYYLTNYLESVGVSVIGVSRNSGGWIQGDISDANFVESLVKREKPNYIFQFAAVSVTNHSALFLNHKAICTGTLNVLEAVHMHSPNTIVFVPGSAVQFKNVGIPINEETEFYASSYYSVARIHNVYLARYYRSLGLNVKIGYLFHHDSPQRSEKHINQYIISSLKNISRGMQQQIILGDIDVCKEFSFAGDIVKAIWLIVNQNQYNELVIGSGKAYSIREWLEFCASRIGVDYKRYFLQNPTFKSDFSVLVSDPSLLLSLGWKPEIDFFMLADMMMGND